MKTRKEVTVKSGSQEYYLTIEKNKSIEIRCTNESSRDPIETIRKFNIGDSAIYGSYNLYYTGKILNIGKKTVSIDASGTGERVKRLSLERFARRNYNYDADRISEHNRIESYYI